MAAWSDNATLMKLLVQMGLDLYEIDGSGRTALAYASTSPHIKPAQDLMTDTEGAKFMISQYDMSEVEELIRKAFGQRRYGMHGLDAPIWASPSLFQNYRATYYQVPVMGRYLSVNWTWVNPALLLHILLNDDGIVPPLFTKHPCSRNSKT